MAEQDDTNRATRGEGGAADLVEAFKNLLGVGDADRGTGDERASDELDSVSSSAEAGGTAQAGVDVGAGVGGEIHGTLDAGGATVGGGVEGNLDTGLGGYDGSAEGEMSIDPVDGSVEGGGKVSIGQDDVVYGRTEGEAGANVHFGPTSFGAGAEASVSYTDPLGVDTMAADAGGSYHHAVDTSGVEAGAALEGTVDTWAGDSYHGEAEADLGFGQGALDVDGSVGLTHTAPFGAASESFEAEGKGHIDSSGWDVEGDAGYELDVGGGAPEVAIGGGFSTNGEWSDAEDAGDDAGDAAQDAYDDAEDAVGGAADDVGDAAGDVFG